MALYKAGVEYENHQVTFEQWPEFKGNEKLPYGQMPVLELADGTTIAQMVTILEYIASLYPQLKSNDPLLNAKADQLAQFCYADAHGQIGPMTFSEEADRDAKVKELADKFIPTLFKSLAASLTDDKKFLTGDTVTIYDITVGGLFTNLICNPKAMDAAMWKTLYDSAPERVKKYVTDFQADMKPYLDGRPECFI